MSSEVEVRVLELIDRATDPGWAEELPELGACAPSDFELRQQVTQERIAAALGAIAYLLMRQDDEILRAWRGF